MFWDFRYRLTQFCVALLSPGAVLAAKSSLGEQLEAYTPATVGLVALLIVVGGLTGLLHRLKMHYEEAGELERPLLFAASNLFGAVAAGVTALFLGEYFAFSGALHAVFIIVGAYAGTLLLERLFDWFTTKFFPSDRTPFARLKRKPRDSDANLGEDNDDPQRP